MSNLSDRKAHVIKPERRSLITRRAVLLPTLTLLASPQIAKAYLLQSPSSCSSSSYTGPGDVLSLTTFWSPVRAYNQTYAAACGLAAIFRRSSDDAELTVNFLTTGEIDVSALVTWAGGSNLFVKQCYDQTGNGRHVLQTTKANQPQYFSSGGPNNKPYIEVVNNGNGMLASSSTYSGASPTSFMAVGNRVAGTSGNLNFVRTAGNRLAGGITSTRLNLVGSGGGSVAATSNAANNVWHALQGSLITGGTSRLRSSGTAFTATGVTIGTDGAADRFCGGEGASTIQMCEGGYINGTQWSSTDETNMASNQTGFYGAI